MQVSCQPVGVYHTRLYQVSRNGTRFVSQNQKDNPSMLSRALPIQRPHHQTSPTITIFHDNKPVKDKVPKASKPVLIVEVPRPFPYMSERMVSWRYQCNYTNEAAAADLMGVEGMTRSGHCYSPIMMKKLTPKKLIVPMNEE